MSSHGAPDIADAGASFRSAVIEKLSRDALTNPSSAAWLRAAGSVDLAPVVSGVDLVLQATKLDRAALAFDIDPTEFGVVLRTYCLGVDKDGRAAVSSMTRALGAEPAMSTTLRSIMMEEASALVTDGICSDASSSLHYVRGAEVSHTSCAVSVLLSSRFRVLAGQTISSETWCPKNAQLTQALALHSASIALQAPARAVTALLPALRKYRQEAMSADGQGPRTDILEGVLVLADSKLREGGRGAEGIAQLIRNLLGEHARYLDVPSSLALHDPSAAALAKKLALMFQCLPANLHPGGPPRACPAVLDGLPPRRWLGARHYSYSGYFLDRLTHVPGACRVIESVGADPRPLQPAMSL